MPRIRKVELIAEYFIRKSITEKKPITNKKLQKLLYYSQAWSLVFLDKKLFNERIEAWLHGPAIPCIYHKYKSFGYNSIKKNTTLRISDLISDAKVNKFLDNVWKIYGKFDANYLEILSHKEKPWQLAREGVDEFNPSNKEITIKSMKDFYSELLRR